MYKCIYLCIYIYIHIHKYGHIDSNHGTHLRLRVFRRSGRRRLAQSRILLKKKKTHTPATSCLFRRWSGRRRLHRSRIFFVMRHLCLCMGVSTGPYQHPWVRAVGFKSFHISWALFYYIYSFILLHRSLMDLSAPQGVRGYPSGLSIAIYVHIRSGGIPEHPRVRGVSQWALCYSIYHEL